MITVNDKPCSELRLSLPRIGAWSGVLVCESPSPLSSVEIKAGLTFAGKARHSGVVVTACNTFVVGGADGLGRTARARFYRSATVRTIVGDLVKDAGEALDDAADAAVLSTIVPFWTTTAMPVGDALGLLLRTVKPGTLWRLTPSGRLWFGTETWPVTSAAFTVLRELPEEQQLEVGMDAIGLLPGQALADGRHVDRVEYAAQGGSIRATVWTL